MSLRINSFHDIHYFVKENQITDYAKKPVRIDQLGALIYDSLVIKRCLHSTVTHPLLTMSYRMFLIARLQFGEQELAKINFS